jgi:hypothetical protein
LGNFGHLDFEKKVAWMLQSPTMQLLLSLLGPKASEAMWSKLVHKRLELNQDAVTIF